MTLKVIPPKRAFSLAETHQPIAWQGFNHFWDFPCEILTGINGEMLTAMTRGPVAYYWCRTDGKDYYYIGYAFYHTQDWAPFPANLLPGEVHRHDLEGVLCRVPYYLPHCSPQKLVWTKGLDIITVFHHELKHWSSVGVYRPYVEIDSGGHGIHSYNPCAAKKVYLYVEDWRLLPFEPIMADGSRREIIRQNFNNNGVHLPDEWSNHGQYKGWFWSKPDELFKEMGK
jgi:hypothetical protein